MLQSLALHRAYVDRLCGGILNRPGAGVLVGIGLGALLVAYSPSSWSASDAALSLPSVPWAVVACCLFCLGLPSSGWGSKLWTVQLVSSQAASGVKEPGPVHEGARQLHTPSQQGSRHRLPPPVKRLLSGLVSRRTWEKAAVQVIAAAKGASQWRPLRRPQTLGGLVRQPSDSGSSASGHDGSLWRRRSRLGSSWRPSMTRILSGQHLHGMLDDSSSASTSAATSRGRGKHGHGASSRAEYGGCELPLVPHTGHLAVDCMQHHSTHPAAAGVEEVITTQHLLQFGALLGESSAELALSQSGAASAQGTPPASLLGSTDNPGQWGRGWEQLLQQSCGQQGVYYWAWRHYLRRGLYMYKSRTVFEGLTTAQLVAFYFDSAYKLQWDDSCTALVELAAPGAPTAALQEVQTEELAAARSAYVYARSRFPAPMAQREYVYARHVWAKADDGGCYIVSRAAHHPGAPAAGGRTVTVQDFVSGIVIRDASLETSGPAAEIVTVYFEDCHVSPGIVNLGVRKALWPLVTKMNAALRQHVATPRGTAMLLATSAALQQACGTAGAGTQSADLAVTAGTGAGLRRCASTGGESLRSSTSEGAMDLPTGRTHSALVHTFSTPAVSALAEAPTANSNMSTRDRSSTQSQLCSAPCLGTSSACKPTKSLTAGAAGAGAGAKPSMYLWAAPAELAAPLLKVVQVAWRQHAAAAACVLYVARLPWQAGWALRGVVRGLRGLLCWAVQRLGLEHRITSLRDRAQRKADALASHPVDVGSSSSSSSSPEGRRGKGKLKLVARKWLARRVALLAVRVLSVPLAHRVLSRNHPSSPSLLSRSNSMSSHAGGGSTAALHGGRGGVCAQPSRRESTARVLNWLDPVAAPDYLLGQHAEMLQQHYALQQLHDRRRRAAGGVAQPPPMVSTSSGGGAAEGGPLSPSRLGRTPMAYPVVEGVMLVKPSMPADRPPRAR